MDTSRQHHDRSTENFLLFVIPRNHCYVVYPLPRRPSQEIEFYMQITCLIPGEFHSQVHMSFQEFSTKQTPGVIPNLKRQTVLIRVLVSEILL